MRVQKPKGFRHKKEKCRKSGCDKPAINGYCSKDHAPYGNLVDAPDDYLNYPTDLPDAPPSRHRIHKSCCDHKTNCPYTCRSKRLKFVRARMNFDDRCLCSCHSLNQHEIFEDYE